MKRLLAVLILISGVVYAADDDSTNYSPIFVSSSGTKLGSPKIVFNEIPTGSKAQNCITDISVSASNFDPGGFTISILDGNTTSYSLSQTTMSLIESWYPRNPFCLSPNTSTYFTISAGNFKINISGYEKRR